MSRVLKINCVIHRFCTKMRGFMWHLQISRIIYWFESFVETDQWHMWLLILKFHLIYNYKGNHVKQSCGANTRFPVCIEYETSGQTIMTSKFSIWIHICKELLTLHYNVGMICKTVVKEIEEMQRSAYCRLLHSRGLVLKLWLIILDV